MSVWTINPKTKKRIKVGGPKYKELVASGVIKPVSTISAAAGKASGVEGEKLRPQSIVLLRRQYEEVATDRYFLDYENAVTYLLNYIVENSKGETEKLYRTVLAQESTRNVSVNLGINHWSITESPIVDGGKSTIERFNPSFVQEPPVVKNLMDLIQRYGVEDLSNDDWEDIRAEAEDYSEEDVNILTLLVEGKVEEALSNPDALYHAIKYHDSIVYALHNVDGVVGGSVFVGDMVHITEENASSIVPFLRSLETATQINLNLAVGWSYDDLKNDLKRLGPHSALGVAFLLAALTNSSKDRAELEKRVRTTDPSLLPDLGVSV